MESRQYIAIDLKSFYASVECVERNLDPLKANLVVADESRTAKTICLAVSPSLKSYGISGRARLFEVLQKVDEINSKRRYKADGKRFSGSSYMNDELLNNKNLELDFIIAPPQMYRYMQVSSEVYKVYLEYIAPEDIHVYSVDEVFIDATKYLALYKCTAKELAIQMINDVLKKTGITATCGIGTNLFLAKVAMDIVAKHMSADENGVRIAELDEMKYREQLWNHRPITDFWRVGRGYSKRLESVGLFTMRDIAACSIGSASDFYNEDLLYKMFGVSAELLIDHAWGYEPCTIEEIKKYTPKSTSLTTGQVLKRPYKFEEGKVIVLEMSDLLVLDLVSKSLMTNQLTLTVGYDAENAASYTGECKTDFYGRQIPKHAHATINLESYMSSEIIINKAVLETYERIVNPELTVRRINISANNLKTESEIEVKPDCCQLSLFTDYEKEASDFEKRKAMLEKEKREQKAVIEIRNKYGKNAILRGINFDKNGTTIERNSQIGGHRA